MHHSVECAYSVFRSGSFLRIRRRLLLLLLLLQMLLAKVVVAMEDWLLLRMNTVRRVLQRLCLLRAVGCMLTGWRVLQRLLLLLLLLLTVGRVLLTVGRML